ncbi:MAG: response regulator [Chromatiales bacterium]|jgi:putative two-component system response regulator
MQTKPRILVVDDESFYREVLENLMRNDYQVVLAESGDQALEIAVQQPKPDLIILDVVMPGIDGYEVCRQLKADPQTEDIPVIFLTVKSNVDDEVRGFNLGAVDYITKPMSPPIVMARVRTHLKLRQLHDQLLQMIEQLKN